MRNKMRTAATGIAVASGIFLLIVLLGASNGIIHTLEQNSEGLSLDAIPDSLPSLSTASRKGDGLSWTTGTSACQRNVSKRM